MEESIAMRFQYFNDYKKHEGAKVNPSLLWEYNLANFDFDKMCHIVVQRIVERGRKNDWYAMLNMYGEEGVRETIKRLVYLNEKDMNFVSLLFNIPLSEMKCYTKKQSQTQRWNS